jgi:hypothetical protein
MPAVRTLRRAGGPGRFLLRVSVCAVLLMPAVQAQSDVTLLVDRAVAYVGEFQRRFGSMVSEERYEQSVQENTFGPRSARPQFERVVLVSDFLLVQVAGEGWTPFRDVFERNGVKLRDREERLAKLFLNGSTRPSFDQAREIMLESSRYNIGSVERTINVPTLPLAFLTPAHRGRFRFELTRRDDDSSVVEFREVTTPTYVSTTGGRDLPVNGRFWLDEATGAVRRSELDAVDTAVEAHIKVSYRFDDSLRLWVPGRMEERYRNRRTTTEVRGVASYSRFRKFQVSTSEELVKDP